MKLSLGDFEKLANESFSNIPLEFRKRLENIEIVIENRPNTNPFKVKKFALRGLLGLYRGVPLRRRGAFYSSALPDRITLYKDNIESCCGTTDELKEKIEEVLLHEVGHYFGLSEEELRTIERKIDR